MNDAFYFPIHRAKAGEIAGVAHLSPRTRTRVRPAFEVQKQRDDDDTPLEEHLSRVAHQLLAAWGSRYPLFADFSQFGPEDRTADGTHCAEFFFRCLRQQSMLGIPMTEPGVGSGAWVWLYRRGCRDCQRGRTGRSASPAVRGIQRLRQGGARNKRFIAGLEIGASIGRPIPGFRDACAIAGRVPGGTGHGRGAC